MEEARVTEDKRRAASPVRAWLIGAVGLAVLWVVTFYATGLLWWNAPDRYGARIPRFEPLVAGVPGESQAESAESAPRGK
jgi:hypothetical protein